jgi:hypothetical protein
MKAVRLVEIGHPFRRKRYIPLVVSSLLWPIRVTTPSRDTLAFTRPFPKVWRVIVLLQRRGRERKLPYGIGCDFCTLIPAN